MANNTDRERDRLLAASGFDDIEYRTGDLRSLPGPAHVRAEGTSLTHEDYAATEEYYRRAGRFLHSGYRFTSAEEEAVWALHVEGVGCRQTAAKLGMDKMRVNRIVRQLQAKMSDRDNRCNSRSPQAIYRQVERMDWCLLLMLAPALLGGK